MNKIIFCGNTAWGELIKESKAVILGTSAGAINMTDKWVCSKYNRYKVEKSVVYRGLGLNNFSFQPHFEVNNHQLLQELFPLSEEIDIYGAVKDGAVRVVNGKIDIIGNVYLISQSSIQKLPETL